MAPGVDIEISKGQKDELQLTGNSLEAVSQSAADLQQICKVRNKDIRKVSDPDTLGTMCLPNRSGAVVLGRPLRVGTGAYRRLTYS